MTPDGPLPRRFGAYLLTAPLGSDALGRVFRALRVSGERGFVRLRIFESSEISEDAVLDAIEENGEIHTFLKNPAIARGVQMDAVEGAPFLAWDEPNGRTLDALLARAAGHGIPVEHALLIAEKVATALDHAYNTTVDGERTLHGFVWPGFVSVSDDGETRLTGFGLASGFLPSMGQPRLSREVAPYLAPEERADLSIAKNSDVFSVGVLIFELLFGRLPWPSDPLGDLRTASRRDAPIPSEVTAVLHNCLAPADSRYQSSGELRRELGKVLFSGPSSPSTFNLAFFLNSLFSADIEAANRARAVESTLDPEAIAEVSPAPAPAPPTVPPHPQRPLLAAPASHPYAVGGAVLLAAALIGTTYVITRQPHRETPRPVIPATGRSTLKPPPTALPTSLPTSGTTETQVKEEVARRVAAQLKKIEGEIRKSKAGGQAARAPRLEPTESRVAPSEPAAHDHQAPQAASPTVTPEIEPTTARAAGSTSGAQPTRPQAAETSSSPAEFDTPPKILRIVKPVYPPAALQARIGGTVVLRVLVSEDGAPQEIQVLKRAAGGLTEAAAAAVRKWTFESALSHGRPVRAWTTITIPFEP